MGRGFVALAIGGIIASATPGTAAATERCGSLKGTDLSPARQWKVVVGESDEGRALIGCRVPDGRPTVLGVDDELEYSSLDVLDVAGRYALWSQDRYDRTGSECGGGSDVLFARVPNSGGLWEDLTCREAAIAGAVSASGRAVIAVRTADRVRIDALGPHQSWTLDEGPPDAFDTSALAARGRLVSWRRAGAERHALLPDLPRCRLRGTVDGDPSIRVGTRKDRDEEDADFLVACTYPRGKVRVIGENGSLGLGGQSSKIEQAAGRFVLVSGSAGNQYAAWGGAGVVDLRSGKSSGMFRWECMLGDPCTEIPSLTATALNGLGRAGAMFTLGSTTTVAGFSASGGRTDLDTGPAGDLAPASLRFTSDHTLSWAHAGDPRSAELDG